MMDKNDDDDLSHAVVTAVGLLAGLDAAGASPAEARRRARALGEAYPALEVDLVSEREDYARAWHHEILLSRPGALTVNVGLTPDRGLPFIARAAYRPGEDELLRVNGASLRIQDALLRLEIAQDRRALEQLVEGMLIEEEMERRGVDDAPVSDEELQRTLDDLRRDLGLFRAEEMARWLEARGLSDAGLEQRLATLARVRRLRDLVTAPELDRFRATRLSELDLAVVAVATALEPGLAPSLANAEDFFGAVARAAAREAASLEIVSWRRHRCAAELRGPIFDGELPRVVGPLPHEGRVRVVRVLERRRAEPGDDRWIPHARELLFTEWLAARRAAAQVEWFWGTT
jgi:putative peptide maturation system protein